jgi:hydrogenase nickel insertion protein HypA
MHELSIAQNIADIICQCVPEHLFSKAESAKIKIGKFSNISPQALRTGFDMVKQEYEFKEIELLIEEEPLHLLCNCCGRSFDSEEIIFNCIYCNAASLNVINGDLLQISQIILKEE